jgi:hypothetical protein
MITPMEHNLCRRYGCEIPVGEGSFLCSSHIVKLQDMLDQVPEYLQALAPLELATSTPRGNTGGGSGTPGSRPPLNLHAWAIWVEMQSLPTRASDVAHHDPQAGATYKTVASLVAQAYNILDGPDEPVVDRMEAARRIHIAFPAPMTGAEICQQFEAWGIHITRPQLWKWVERGHLQSVGRATDGKTRLYTILGILTALQRTHPTPHPERKPHPIAS